MAITKTITPMQNKSAATLLGIFSLHIDAIVKNIKTEIYTLPKYATVFDVMANTKFGDTDKAKYPIFVTATERNSHISHLFSFLYETLQIANKTIEATQVTPYKTDKSILRSKSKCNYT